MKFRVIPPGEFMMGSSEEQINELPREIVAKPPSIEMLRIESPEHKVTLTSPFGLSIYEVTRGQFRQFVDATGYKTDAEKSGKGGYGIDKDGQRKRAPEFLWNTNLGFDSEQTDDHPVVNVSWNDAVAFCEWLSEKEGVNYRLPTEAEWEFACRAGNRWQYCFGDDESKLADVAWFGAHGGNNTKPVGQKAANPFGVFDLHGNVWEWCLDGFEPYQKVHTIDRVGVDYNCKTMRGGSCAANPFFVRSAARTSTPSELPSNWRGFRLAKTYHSAL